jgi:hydroxyacylglutathione hydrolase
LEFGANSLGCDKTMAKSLEDHAGDIIRKARQMADVSIAAAASAAGFATDDLETLEQTGASARKPDWRALAMRLHLHATKLESIANGWFPAPVDLTIWRELRIISTAADAIGVHCYLVWDEVTREAALFDTGWEAAPILALITENQLQLKHVFITHAHDDHMAALAGVRQSFPKVRLHSSSKHAPPDQRNRPNDFIHLGSLRITHRDTPGHAEDGVTYIVGTFPEDAPNVALVGDAIFAGSIGKGVGSAAALAKQKVRDQIFSLPAATLICPGHGPLTTVGQEKMNNPFFI